MAAVTVSDIEPTELARGFEGTAANPDQFSIRFPVGVEEGVVYIERKTEDTNATEGWPLEAGDKLSFTMVSGQVLYGRAVGAPIELRVLPLSV